MLGGAAVRAAMDGSHDILSTNQPVGARWYPVRSRERAVASRQSHLLAGLPMGWSQLEGPSAPARHRRQRPGAHTVSRWPCELT